MLTFRQWCEVNGKAWTGQKNYANFSKLAEGYETYRGNKDGQPGKPGKTKNQRRPENAK